MRPGQTFVGIFCLVLLASSNSHFVSEAVEPEVEDETYYSFRDEFKGKLRLEQDMTECLNLIGQDLMDEISNYQTVANQIIEEAVNGSFKGRTYNELAKFVDKFGSRLSGSSSLENSIDYMITKMKDANGMDKSYGEEAIIPHWVRGKEVATMIEPRVKNLPLLGLGRSIGTTAEGITAEVYVVGSFDELEANAEKAKGKIVVYNQEYSGYGSSVLYRSNGASAASRVGAVAALVRSIAPFSLDTPHTGGQNYAEDVTHIPVACITIEDAEMLYRLQEEGETIRISLVMLDYNLPLTTSRNAIGELTGSEKPNEIVIVSGHIDSWDVGQGAMDDGGGCLISTEAVALIKYLGLKPKRSIQAVLWTSEEAGLYGAQDYARHHKDNMANIVAAFESDAGTFNPLGLDFEGTDAAGCIVNEILKLTDSIGTTAYAKYPSVSTDIRYLTQHGVPGLSLANKPTDGRDYFWYHHTEADTMTLLDSEELDKGMALWAVASYVIASLNDPLPRLNATATNFQF